MTLPRAVYAEMDTPIGPLVLVRNELGLTHIGFQVGPRPLALDEGWQKDPTPLRDAMEQLRAYFNGERGEFEVALTPEGTEFQQTVWEALRAVPCGETVTYADIAQRLGKPNAVRAVGAANGRNPIPIIVPCHRIVGKDGKLTGYAGGMAIKRALLDHETRMAGANAQMRLAP